MKRIVVIAFILLLHIGCTLAEEPVVWNLVTEEGMYLTDICYQPEAGDCYIAGNNQTYEILEVKGYQAIATEKGSIELPQVDWIDADAALQVSAVSKRVAMYCTHSDESYLPSDGTYSTTERGSIYQIARALADGLEQRGIEAIVADTLHHPHDAGAYRRSRQTAVQLLQKSLPDALIDIHRDGIPDPDSYAAQIAGQAVSKIRLLVGRGNQNAEANKAFALTIKAVADRVYPGLIKDIYIGKGTFNQDLLPHSILFECGTYTLEKERVLASMPMLADVLDRALYGGVTGSAAHITTDTGMKINPGSNVVEGETDPIVTSDTGTGSGISYLGVLLFIGIVLTAILSNGTMKGGFRKAERNLSEMTGGLVGRKPQQGEEHDHS